MHKDCLLYVSIMFEGEVKNITIALRILLTISVITISALFVQVEINKNLSNT